MAFPTENLAGLGIGETDAFFVAFSRFEYALERSGFLRNKVIAETDWDKFADALGAPFLGEVRKSGKAAEMLEKPPGKPIKQDQQVDWQDAKPVEDVRGLFIAVRQARNNLFHGEKFIGDGRQKSRDRRLLADGLHVLEIALARHEGVRKKFAG